MTPRETAGLLAALWALVCAGTAACTPAATDGGATLPGAGTCLAEADCGDGFRCDTAESRCVCTDDLSCPDGAWCNAYSGRCDTSLSGCKRDTECPVDRYCDPSQRACLARKLPCDPCRIDAECGGGGDLCLYDASLRSFYCGKDCTAGPCPQGYACSDQSESGAGPFQCTPIVGNCEVLRGCQADGDCPIGFRCVAESRRCEPACETDADCQAGYLCDQRTCIPETACDADTDCGAGQVCLQRTKRCMAGCTATTQCPLGTVCQDSQCVPGCATDADCLLSQYCSAGRCVAGCQSAVCCAFGEVCQAGRCATAAGPYCQACTSNAQCRPGGTEPNYCLRDAADSSKRYCGVDCSGGQECPKGYRCASVASSQTCTEGIQCTSGVCLSEGYCQLARNCAPVTGSCLQ